MIPYTGMKIKEDNQSERRIRVDIEEIDDME